MNIVLYMISVYTIYSGNKAAVDQCLGPVVQSPIDRSLIGQIWPVIKICYQPIKRCRSVTVDGTIGP